MINLFNAPHEVNELCEKNGVNSGNYGGFMRYLTRPETYIGAHYCALYDPRVKEMVDNEAEYLYDGAPSWTQAKEISDTVTKECFKCFAREGITMGKPEKTLTVYRLTPAMKVGMRRDSNENRTMFRWSTRDIDIIHPIMNQAVMEGHDVDVFVHTWWNVDDLSHNSVIPDRVHKTFSSSALDQIEELYSPKKMMVEKPKTWNRVYEFTDKQYDEGHGWVKDVEGGIEVGKNTCLT